MHIGNLAGLLLFSSNAGLRQRCCGASAAPKRQTSTPLGSCCGEPLRKAAQGCLTRTLQSGCLTRAGLARREICTGHFPVRGQLQDIKVPEECPPEVRALVLECLETRPSLRPSALQLVARLQAVLNVGPGRRTVSASPVRSAQRMAPPGRHTSAPSTPHASPPRILEDEVAEGAL